MAIGRDWELYVNIDNIPRKYKDITVAAYDQLWANPPERELIIKSYTSNGNVPITVNSGVINDKYGLPALNAGTRENNTYGKAEIAIDYDQMAKLCFSNGSKQIPYTLAAALSHEHHHIAYEENDVSRRMWPAIEKMVEARGGLRAEDIDLLRSMETVTPEYAALYQLKLAKGETLTLGSIEGKPISMVQFQTLTEHLLAPHDAVLRHMLSQVPVDRAYIESLLGGGRLGYISVQEAQSLMHQVDDGKLLMLNDVEAQVGRKFSTAHLMDGLKKQLDAGYSQLSEKEAVSILPTLDILNDYYRNWHTAQLASEEWTVDETDRVNSQHQQFPRESYNNVTHCEVMQHGLPGTGQSVAAPQR